ncbi:hypothetical protein OV450_3349 [Actinobacteria bacterium OV450]|nr:hypothetical protein OV450_3349 [Actinobacteria bacterium OV450]
MPKTCVSHSREGEGFVGGGVGTRAARRLTQFYRRPGPADNACSYYRSSQ